MYVCVQVRLAEVFQSLPEEQRWPCWSKLMFNLSDTPDTNCKVTPYLQQLFEQVCPSKAWHLLLACSAFRRSLFKACSVLWHSMAFAACPVSFLRATRLSASLSVASTQHMPPQHNHDDLAEEIMSMDYEMI